MNVEEQRTLTCGTDRVAGSAQQSALASSPYSSRCACLAHCTASSSALGVQHEGLCSGQRLQTAQCEVRVGPAVLLGGLLVLCAVYRSVCTWKV